MGAVGGAPLQVRPAGAFPGRPKSWVVMSARFFGGRPAGAFPGPPKRWVVMALLASGPAAARGDPGERSAPRVLRSDSRSPRAYEHWLRAHLARQAGDQTRTLDELRLARLYDEASQPVQAALLETRLRSGPREPPRWALARSFPPEHPGSFRALAAAARRSGDRALAARASRQAAATGSAQWSDWRLWAKDLQSLERDVAAVRVLREAVELFAESPEPARALAGLHVGRRRFRAARRAFEWAAQRARDPWLDVAALASLDHRLNEERLAAERIEAALAAWPSRRELWVPAVRAPLWLGTESLALARAERSVRLGTLSAQEAILILAVDGGTVEGSPWLDAAYRHHERLLPAPIRAHKAVLEQRPRDAWRRLRAQPGAEGAAHYRAELCAPSGRRLFVFEHSVGPRPERAWRSARNRLEKGRAGSSDRARLERWRQLHPDDPRVLASLGRWHHLRGGPARGIGDLERAVRLAPHWSLARRWLSDAYEALGRPPNAERVRRGGRAWSDRLRAFRAAGGARACVGVW